MRVKELIARFQLEPHPEGGWFGRVFADKLTVAPADGRGSRPALTAIYYLLDARQRGRWHRVKSAEAWSLLEGGPLLLATFDAHSNQFAENKLASAGGGAPFHAVRANIWQAAFAPDQYAFVSCVVGPGFDWADFAWLSDHPQDLAALRAVAPKSWHE